MLHDGELLHFLPENNVYVYFRIKDDARVMVVLNNNPEEQKLDLSRFSEGIKDSIQGMALFSKTVIDLTKPLVVKGKTPMVISLN